MTRRFRPSDLLAIAVPEQPVLSPDATAVAYVLRTGDLETDRTVRSLWRVGTDGGAPTRLTPGPADTSPSWSPDGRSIAFLRAENDGPAQIWLMPAEGEPRQLTFLPLGAGTPVWSPDGVTIAFAALVDTRAVAGEDEATRARRARAPVVIEHLSYQGDGVGLGPPIRRHLHLLDVRTGDCRPVISGDWRVGEPSWSPDGSQLAFSAGLVDTDADLSRRRPVYLLDVAHSMATPRPVGLADGIGGPVTWTGDGTALLVVGADSSTRMGHQGLHRLPLDGGPAISLSAPLDRNVMPGAPGYPGAAPHLADADTVLFCARDRGCVHLFSVPVSGGPIDPVVTRRGRSVSGLSVAAGRAVLVLGTETSFGEVLLVDLATGTETTLTDHGHDAAAFTLFPRVEREFTAADGTVLPGWLMLDPAGTDPRPLLVDIHGGPHNAWNALADEAHLYHQDLVARGWAVLLLNPRGSDGYGEEFFTAALGAWGRADGTDFLDAVDDLVRAGIADPGRLAVSGYSYGGYMTCYLTGRDDRFAAAVAGGTVADLVSLVGTGVDGPWLDTLELGGPPWADPPGYAAMSPLTRVDRVATPTLLLHGDQDGECPPGQAQQWYTALRRRGVPARLVLYPDASHMFILDGAPSHRIDYGERIVDWVQQYAVQRARPLEPAAPIPARRS